MLKKNNSERKRNNCVRNCTLCEWNISYLKAENLIFSYGDASFLTVRCLLFVNWISMSDKNKYTMKRGWITGTAVMLASLTGCYFDGPCLEGTGPIVSQVREIDGFSTVINTGSFEVQVSLSDTFGVEVEAQENLLSIIETYVSGNSLVIKTKSGTCIGHASPVQVHVSLPSVEGLELSGSGNMELDIATGTHFECSNTGSGFIMVDTVIAGDILIGNSASGTIFVNESFADEVRLVQSGSGTIEAAIIYRPSEVSIHHSSSGKVRSTVADGELVRGILSGSGKIDLAGETETADFTLSASGRIDALDLMAKEVKATNSGSGKIYVYATDYLEAIITGSGDIIYRGDPVISYRITGSGDVRHY
jgi:hypothetical protein